MADHLEVVPGHAPWEPSTDAKLVKTYHRYGVPLVGLIDRHGDTYLFVRRYRGEESLSVWLYAPVASDDVARLDAAAPAQDDSVRARNEFAALLDEVEARGYNLYALTNEDSGVVATCRPTSPKELGDAISEMIRNAHFPANVEVEAEADRLLTAVA
jgi:hypothetical protein